MTRNGIEYDFEKSPFSVATEKYIFVFSSQLHAEKFSEELEENRQRINESLSNRFNFYIHAEELADFILYSRIEKRGYLVRDQKGGAIKCQNEIHIKCERTPRPGLEKRSVTLTSAETAL